MAYGLWYKGQNWVSAQKRTERTSDHKMINRSNYYRKHGENKKM